MSAFQESESSSSSCRPAIGGFAGKRSRGDPRSYSAICLLGLFLTLLSTGCRQTPAGKVVLEDGTYKTASEIRNQRRAFNGAPPVIPHEPLGADCTACHEAGGELFVDELGYAPPAPHGRSEGIAGLERCRQCHVFRQTDKLFRETTFRGFQRPTFTGSQAHPLSPPVMPHPIFMREDCLACHDGTAAREEIRTSHPERERCLQCHLSTSDSTFFSRETS